MFLNKVKVAAVVVGLSLAGTGGALYVSYARYQAQKA